MPDVNVSINEQQWQDLVDRLGFKDASLVASRAINDTLATGRTRLSRSVRKEVTLKAGDVKKGVRLNRAKPGQLRGDLDLNGRRQSLRAFKGRPQEAETDQRAEFFTKGTKTKGGRIRRFRRKIYSYEIRPGQRVTAKEIFVQRIKNPKSAADASGTALPMRRLTRSRNPTAVTRGPSVPGVYQADRQNTIRKDTVGDLRPQLQKRIRGQTIRLLTKQTSRLVRDTVRMENT